MFLLKSLFRFIHSWCCCTVKFPFFFFKKCFDLICSIQTFLCLLFVISLATLGGAIIFLSLHYSTENVKHVFDETQDIIIHHVECMTTRWFNQGPSLIDSVSKWFVRKGNDSDIDIFLNTSSNFGMESLRRSNMFLYGVLSSNNGVGGGDISGLAFGSRIGVMSGVAYNGKRHTFASSFEEDREASCCTYSFNDLFNNSRSDLPGPLRFQRINEDDLSVGAWYSSGWDHIDFRLLPWYITSKKEDYTWNIFVNTLGWISCHVARKVHDLNDEFVGVVDVQYTFQFGVSQFVGELNSHLTHGDLYLVEQNKGILMAGTSYLDKIPVKVDPITGQSSPITVFETEDKILLSAFEYILSDSSSGSHLSEVSKIRRKEFVVEGEGTYLLEGRSTGKEIKGGLKVPIVYICKKSEIFESIDRGNNTSITINCCFILIMGLASIIIICLIMIPLVQLGNEMKKVEKMKLDKIRIFFFCISPFTEIRHLQKRFRYTVSKLKEFRAFLPDYITNDPEKGLLEEGDLRSDSSFEGNSGIEGSDIKQGTPTMSISRRLSLSLSRRSYLGEDGVENTSESSTDSMDSVIVPQNKFGLCLSKKFVVCMYIFISNWREVYESGIDELLNKYALFLEFVSTLIKKSGSVFQFQLDRIVVYYPRSNLIHAVNHSRKIEDVVKGKRYAFKVVVGMTLDLSIIGVIGNKFLKTNCVFDGSVEKAKYMIDCFFKNNNNNSDICTVLICGSILAKFREIRRSIFCLPYNIFLKPPIQDVQSMFSRNSGVEEDSNFNYIYVFKTIPEKKSMGEVEWMYALDQEKREESNKMLLDSFCHLNDGNIRKAKKCLLKCTTQDSSFDSNSSEEDESRVKYRTEIQQVDDDDDSSEEESRKEDDLVCSAKKLLEIIGLIENHQGREFEFRDYLDNNAKEITVGNMVYQNPSVLFSLEEKGLKPEEIT